MLTQIQWRGWRRKESIHKEKWYLSLNFPIHKIQFGQQTSSIYKDYIRGNKHNQCLENGQQESHIRVIVECWQKGPFSLNTGVNVSHFEPSFIFSLLFLCSLCESCSPAELSSKSLEISTASSQISCFLSWLFHHNRGFREWPCCTQQDLSMICSAL